VTPDTAVVYRSEVMMEGHEPATRDLIGERYELRELIGEGTFGRVYRAWDRRLARAVAIKVSKAGEAADPQWLRRLEEEARTLARLGDPGIVQVFDFGTGPEGTYYVAELVEGENLARRLRRGLLGPREAVRIAERVARALGHAHAHGVVHLDVTPANILLGPRGEVKVGDFGAAAPVARDGAGHPIIGTARYMAPEQAAGRQTSAASDVYALGVIMREMLTGEADPAAVLAPAVGPELRAILDRCVAADPLRRFADAGALAEALDAAAAGLAPDPAASAGAPSPARAIAPPVATSVSPSASTRVIALPATSVNTTAVTRRAPVEQTSVGPPARPVSTDVVTRTARMPAPGVAALPPQAARRRRGLRKRRIALGCIVLLIASTAASYAIDLKKPHEIQHLLGLPRTIARERLGQQGYAWRLADLQSARYSATVSGG
jgi:serine/threonine protein kinase